MHGGIFYLTPEELPRLMAGEDLTKVIAARRRRRTMALSLEVPPVLFSDDLEAIGRPVADRRAPTVKGCRCRPASPRRRPWCWKSRGPTTCPREPYILVCPSTDPAWVPLFVQAQAGW